MIAHLLESVPQLIWGSAIRQWELLHGLVDLRDAELGAELDQGVHEDESVRGIKRPADTDPSAFTTLPPTNFHARPFERAGSTHAPKPRRRSSSSASRSKAESGAGIRADKPATILEHTRLTNEQPVSTMPSTLPPSFSPNTLNRDLPKMPPPPPVSSARLPQASLDQPMPASLPSTSAQQQQMFFAQLAAQQQVFQQQQQSSPTLPMEPLPSLGELHGSIQPQPPGIFAHEAPHQTYDILTAGGPALDLSQFRSPPGTSGGVTNFSALWV